MAGRRRFGSRRASRFVTSPRNRAEKSKRSMRWLSSTRASFEPTASTRLARVWGFRLAVLLIRTSPGVSERSDRSRNRCRRDSLHRRGAGCDRTCRHQRHDFFLPPGPYRAHLEIYGSVFRGCGQGGVYVREGGAVVVRESLVVGNDLHGVTSRGEGSRVDVENTDIARNRHVGLWAHEGGFAQMANSIVTGNGFRVVSTSLSGEVDGNAELSRNLFWGNRRGVFRDGEPPGHHILADPRAMTSSSCSMERRLPSGFGASSST